MEDFIQRMESAVPESSLILSADQSIDLMKNNQNILVLGSAGTGKTRYFLKPNLLQANYSYIVTDPFRECFTSTAEYMLRQGYEISVLNLDDPSCSTKYNPLEYVYSESDAFCLAQTLIGEKSETEELFMHSMSINLLTCILLLAKEIKSERTLCLCDVDIMLSDYDWTMDLLDQVHGSLIASAAYKVYQSSGIRKKQLFDIVAKSIREKLKIFCDSKYKTIFDGKDELKLNRTSVKRILYIIAPAFGDTQRIVSTVYAQSILTIASVERLFQNVGRRFDHKTIMFMDEFANTIYIPNFDVLLNKCRKHVCCVPIIQGVNQLQKLYPKTCENILDSFDIILYMGTTSLANMELISKKANISISELREMNMDQCGILHNWTKSWFMSEKYHLEYHPKYDGLK